MTTLPRDPRALRVAQAFIDAPGSRERVADLCRRCAVTPRTIQRLFVRDVGMNFEAWRRQARLMKGVELLMHGHSVAAVAASVGYQQPNAFITLFRQTLGTTPAAWASARAAGLR